LCETNKGRLWFYNYEIPNVLLKPFLKKAKMRREFEDKENEIINNMKEKECEHNLNNGKLDIWFK